MGNQRLEDRQRISQSSSLRQQQVTCANTPHELQQMLQELADESKNQGPKMTPIYVNNTQIENVESYIYLGQRYSIKDKNQDKEIQRRMTAGWTVFSKHRDTFKGNSGTCLKRQVYNSCILPAITYGAETWALTTLAKNKLVAAQTKMERTKVTGVIEQVRRQVDLGRACRHDTR